MKTIITAVLAAVVILDATYAQASKEQAIVGGQKFNSSNEQIDKLALATYKLRENKLENSSTKKSRTFNYNAILETKELELNGDRLLKENKTDEAVNIYVKAIIFGLNNVKNFEERRLQYKIRRIKQNKR